MSAPPVPPRPYESYESYDQPQRKSSLPPPLPPLPSAVRVQEERYNTPSPYEYPVESPPHFDDPLAAPRPHRLDPTIPANMARNLDEQLYTQQDYARPPPGAGMNYTPGFMMPSHTGSIQNRPPTQPQGAQWSPWAPQAYSQQPQQQQPQQPPQQQQPQYQPSPYGAPPAQRQSPTSLPNSAAPDLSQSMAALSFSSAPSRPHQARHQSTYGPAPAAPSAPWPTTAQPSLTAPIPTIANLQAAANVVQNPSHDSNLKVAWCRDVFFLVERMREKDGSVSTTSTDPIMGPAVIPDPTLASLARTAVNLVLQLASSPQSNPMAPWHAEAIHLRALLLSTGSFPGQVQPNPRSAFRDFETAARAGYSGAWFRIGRDYESFSDFSHARECFDRGSKAGVEACVYRLGMAHLLGQLGLAQDLNAAVGLLQRAATLASLEVPQPAYVYALLLLSEFTQVTVPPSLFAPYIPAGSSPTLEARKHLERAAFLHFAPAQYKLGHAYEFALPPFPFDPLLSVQYYSLASQQGEVEADMALSKWFLCGSGDAGEGGFDKDEALAWTFAERAARKGLPSAEFAMGYYNEVGVGGPKDVREAIKWYTKARDHGNTDAASRLSALSLPSPQALSRQEHDSITENKLVRKRTQAKQRAETVPMSPPYNGTSFPVLQQQQPQAMAAGREGQRIVEVIRKNTVMYPGSFPSQPGYPQQQQQQQQQQQPLHPVHQQSYPSPQPANPNPSPNPRPQKPPGQQYPAAHRYTLTDAPSPSSSDYRQSGRTQSPARQSQPGRTQSPGGRKSPAGRKSPGRAGGNMSLDVPPPLPTSGGGSALPTPRPAATPGKGPATFAEMGFTGAKAEDKECVIM